MAHRVGSSSGSGSGSGWWRWPLAAAVVAGTAVPCFAHDMMYVGRTSAGQMTIFIEDGLLPNMMVPSLFPEFPGWIQPEFGLETIGENVPEYNLYTIASSSNIVLRLVSTDPGVYLQKEMLGGPLQVGETYTLGHPYFHMHPVWTIDDVEIGRIYSMTFVLQDTTGQYTDSAPFTLTFGCTPCPADFDRSAFVDLDDFIEFVGAFIDGDERADFDHSGFVDTDDFDAFVRAFEAGC